MSGPPETTIVERSRLAFRPDTAAEDAALPQMGSYHRPGARRSRAGEGDEKGPAARRRPKAAREAYCLWRSAGATSGPPQTTIVECSRLAFRPGTAAEDAALPQMGLIVVLT
jgi:hypothetical protein